ncbi:MAG: ATP-binding protein [Myxococcota bacterium]
MSSASDGPGDRRDRSSQLEAHLRHQDRLQALGTLASGVAHEINNPIQGILGYAQLIQQRTGRDEAIHRFAEEIIGECGRVARIVSSLLAFSRPQVPQRWIPVEVDHLISTTLSLLLPSLRQDGIIVHREVPPALPPVACRGDEIRQVLLNLITNARDALNARFPGDEHDDKTIVLRVHYVEASNALAIEVEDRGAGIESAIIDQIFDPFFTTKEADEGTGLGLAVSHGIIREHGGELGVESKAGEGTRFTVLLPVDGPGE